MSVLSASCVNGIQILIVEIKIVIFRSGRPSVPTEEYFEDLTLLSLKTESVIIAVKFMPVVVVFICKRSLIVFLSLVSYSIKPQNIIEPRSIHYGTEKSSPIIISVIDPSNGIGNGIDTLRHEPVHSIAKLDFGEIIH